MCLPYYLLLFFFLTFSFLIHFSCIFSFRIAPLRFQTGCRRRRLNLDYSFLGGSILRCCIFVFNALHLINLVMIGLVCICLSLWFNMVFLLALFLVISVLAKRLAGKSVSYMTYIVSSGTLNLNSINQTQSIHFFNIKETFCVMSCCDDFLVIVVI